MENLCLFTSSRGLAKACQVQPQIFRSDVKEVILDITRIKGHATVYVPTSSLIYFCINYLPKFDFTFTLVSGDSDLSPSQVFHDQPEMFETLISDNRLSCWFAQNQLYSSSKLCPMPIGMDYHSVSAGAVYWSMTKATPLAQENLLRQTLQFSERLENRIPLVYANWNHNLNSQDRQACLRELNEKLRYVEPLRMPRISIWQRTAKFAFNSCPSGIGTDTHRLWESIILGTIPIITKSASSDYLERLPVIMVRSWNELCEARLQDEYGRISIQKFDFRPLILDYWRRRWENADDILKEFSALTFREFRAILCSQEC